MGEQSEQVIQQTTMILPYFDYEVPVLCLSDGSRYIPVIALCEMLGLRSDIHIPRWRKLVLWCNARRLSWCPSTGRGRIVWCLHLGALSFWLNSFNWSLVSPERRVQLRQAMDAWLKLTEQAHQEMLTKYRQTRRCLFEFLVANANADAALSRFAALPSSLLENGDAQARLEVLAAEGRALIEEATSRAYRVLDWQADGPIMDVVKLGKEGQMEEVGSLPLFPLVPSEAWARFTESFQRLDQWQREVAAFLSRLDFRQGNDDQQ